MKIEGVKARVFRVFADAKTRQSGKPNGRDLVYAETAFDDRIIIKRNGGHIRLTVGVEKQGVFIRATSEATCSMSDEFDLEFGVKLAAVRIAIALGLPTRGCGFFVGKVWDMYSNQ